MKPSVRRRKGPRRPPQAAVDLEVQLEERVRISEKFKKRLANRRGRPRLNELHTKVSVWMPSTTYATVRSFADAKKVSVSRAVLRLIALGLSSAGSKRSSS